MVEFKQVAPGLYEVYRTEEEEKALKESFGEFLNELAPHFLRNLMDRVRRESEGRSPLKPTERFLGF